jgi:hypothetical protein
VPEPWKRRVGASIPHCECCRTLELEAGNFVEELHCVALHPAAGFLLVGFQDKLRLYTVLEDELK